MCDRRGVVTICKERKWGCPCVGSNSDRTRSFFFGPGAPAMSSSEGGRWKGGGGSFLCICCLAFGSPAVRTMANANKLFQLILYFFSSIIPVSIIRFKSLKVVKNKIINSTAGLLD